MYRVDIFTLSKMVFKIFMVYTTGAVVITNTRTSYKFGTFTGTKFTSALSWFRKENLDRVNVGSLLIPTVGCGSISWFVKNNDDKEILTNLFNTAQDLSMHFFDTAERYGSSGFEAFGGGWGGSELLLGKYQSHKELIIATKFTPVPWRLDDASVVKACEASRIRLGVDAIDLYQIHMPDIVQPFKGFGYMNIKDKNYWDGLIECYRRGIIKNCGVCNYGPTLLLQAAEYFGKRGVPLVSNQINYSLLYRNELSGAQKTVDTAQSLGIATLAYYPLAMGLLTGKYSAYCNPPTKKQQSSTLTSTSKTPLELKDLNSYTQIEPLIKIIRDIAIKRKSP